MRLEAALVGDLEKVMRDELKSGAHAVSGGTGKTTNTLKERLRAMVMEAFGSQRLANTWRGAVYPKSEDSLGAAGTVWSKAPHIMEAFSATTLLRNKDGFYLAIPSPEALAMRTSNGKRPTPHEIEQRLGIKLTFVYRRGKAGLLVANLRRRTGKRGGFAAPSATAIKRGNTESVVMFFLVQMVKTKKLFDLDAEYDRALDQLVANILSEWERA